MYLHGVASTLDYHILMKANHVRSLSFQFVICLYMEKVVLCECGTYRSVGAGIHCDGDKLGLKPSSTKNHFVMC